MPIQPGTDIGRYHILEQLGEGGMAVVYKAYDTQLEREVALKFIQLDDRNMEMGKKRFIKEAQALARLNHANIIPIIDFGEYDGLSYLVMPCLTGRTLKQRMGRPINWQQAAALLQPIASALAYAHENQILHRDVKPSNILFDEKNNPILSDFGIAKQLEQEVNPEDSRSIVLGTADYMAPERIVGKKDDVRGDVYSLGVVLYQMLTRQIPFEAETPLSSYYKKIHGDVLSPRKLNKHIPDWVEQVILKAIAADAQSRFQTMHEFEQVLDSMKKGEKVQLDIPAKKKSPSIIKFASIAFGVAALALAVYFFIMQPAVNPGIPPSTSTFLPGLAEATPSIQPAAANAIPSPAISPTPGFIATGSRSIASGKIRQASISKDGQKIAILDEKGIIQIYTMGEKSEPLTIKPDREAFDQISLNPQGDVLATRLKDSGVYLFNAGDGTLIRKIFIKNSGMLYSANGRFLSVVCADHFVRFYVAADCLQTSSGCGNLSGEYAQVGVVSDLALSRDGYLLLTSSPYQVRMYIGGTIKYEVSEDLAGGSDLFFSPSEKYFTWYRVGTMKIIRTQNMTTYRTFNIDVADVLGFMFSPDERFVFVLTPTDLIILNLQDGSSSPKMPLTPQRTNLLAFGIDEEKGEIYVMGEDGFLYSFSMEKFLADRK